MVVRCLDASTGGICKDPAILRVLVSRLGSLLRPAVGVEASNPRELADVLRLIALEALLPPREYSRALALAELLDEHPAGDCCAHFAEIALRGCTAEKIGTLVELEAAAAEKCAATAIVLVEERRYALRLLNEKPPPEVKLLLYWGPTAPPPSIHPANIVVPRDLAKSLRGSAYTAVDIGEGYVALLEE